MQSRLISIRQWARLLAVALTISLASTSGWLSKPAYGSALQGKGKKTKKAKEGKPGRSAESASAVDSGKAKDTSDKGKKAGKKAGNNVLKAATVAPTVAGRPVLWASRGNLSDLNLFWGAGSEELAPKPPFTFEKEDTTGTNPKVKVVDANGVRWNVKFDEEVHAEVAASRLAWACGFLVEESYFIPSGRINGVQGLTRAKRFVGSDGSFTSGMFEKRPDTIARRNVRWSWESNPFVGTKELSGLAILNTMLNNWDAKVDNNNILTMFGDDQEVYDWYVQSDWGGTFGKMGGFLSHTKWDVKDFARQRFIDSVSSGKLQLHYSGKMGGALRSVPVEHGRWFAGIVGQLSDTQLRDAFEAAGATDAEADGFTARLREKIEELKKAVGR